jgi:hypothetical protein
MMIAQLTLDLGERTLMFVAMCPECGPVAAVPVEDAAAGGRWDIAEKWCYIARKAHDQEVHGNTEAQKENADA